MTYSQLAQYMNGTTATLRTDDGLHVNVQVLDARQVFNRTDLLVQPHADTGHGQVWVSAARVTIAEVAQ